MTLHRLWWDQYGKWLFEQCSGAQRFIIGKVTADRLHMLGVP
jgi:hypothetical protein